MSEIVRRRIAALLLLAGAVVAALAIADVGPFEDPPTVEERVQAAAEEFFAAASRGDARSFCEHLTDDKRDSLSAQVATLTGEDDPPGCRGSFKVVGKIFEGSELTVRRVSVSGNRARVEARLRIGERAAQPNTIELLEVEGEWQIAEFD